LDFAEAAFQQNCSFKPLALPANEFDLLHSRVSQNTVKMPDVPFKQLFPDQSNILEFVL
jgi:hypothetical protein